MPRWLRKLLKIVDLGPESTGSRSASIAERSLAQAMDENEKLGAAVTVLASKPDPLAELIRNVKSSKLRAAQHR